MAMLVFLAMSCLIVSAIFLTIGFFEFLELLEGYTGAAFGVGGLSSRRRPHLYARDSTRKAGQSPASLSWIDGSQRVTTIAKPSQKAEFANNIETVAPFLDILKKAGMEREVRKSRNNCILSRWSPSRCLRASSLAAS